MLEQFGVKLQVAVDRVVEPRLERAVPVAEQHADQPADAVGDDQVRPLVRVDVGHGRKVVVMPATEQEAGGADLGHGTILPKARASSVIGTRRTAAPGP